MSDDKWKKEESSSEDGYNSMVEQSSSGTKFNRFGQPCNYRGRKKGALVKHAAGRKATWRKADKTR